MSHVSNAILQDRALMFKKVRRFFEQRKVLEVDTPLLSRGAPIDAHIDLFEVDLEKGKKGYLSSSPEYGMKRLLSHNIGPIYQLCHVFRKEEEGKNHVSEFTLLEWYRPYFSFKAFLKEATDLIALFKGPLDLQELSYEKAFLKGTGENYKKASLYQLKKCAFDKGIETSFETREDLLNLLWSSLVEKSFPKGKLTLITNYPPDQAALAKIEENDQGEKVAKRFEIYFETLELANGYFELNDPKEQKKRLEIGNKQREKLGKKKLPIDYNFLKALEKGIPSSYGIAMGFDRLMMLRHHAKDIKTILPFNGIQQTPNGGVEI